MYDIIIVGGGPAGLTAAIYALRGGASVLLLEKTLIGGQAARLNEITNFPSYSSINGYELTDRMFNQASALGLTVMYEEVNGLTRDEGLFTVTTPKGSYSAKSVIIATGATHTTLGIEQDYIGKGAHYCATCDGFFYTGKTVALVGSGRVALTEALYLSNIVGKLYFVFKGDENKSKVFLSPLLAKNNVEIIYNYLPTKIEGQTVERLNLENASGEHLSIDIDGLFVSVGTTALTGFVANTIDNKNGSIIANGSMKTNLDGVFACGDCLNKELKQIVTACSEGATAGESALEYLQNH
ncbi:MAG: FAD-dependent oxidoreductase [Clostridia bacterium]|nr:FAD-dependent oxidoreductase [Clostridia bacterium]